MHLTCPAILNNELSSVDLVINNLDCASGFGNEKGIFFSVVHTRKNKKK